MTATWLRRQEHPQDAAAPIRTSDDAMTWKWFVDSFSSSDPRLDLPSWTEDHDKANQE
jgi:hypothetical protein